MLHLLIIPLQLMSTSLLRHIAYQLDCAPSWAFENFRSFREARIAVTNELLARDLPSIADESGGYACVAIPGVN